MTRLNRYFIIAAALFTTANSFAFYSTMTTGDLLEPGTFKAQTELQFITNNDDGANIVGHFDGYLTQDMNWRAELGTGTTDFHAAALVKWIPFPDSGEQPALGLMAGVGFANFESETETSLRVHPLISKRFKVDFGELVPYASVPFGISSYADDTYNPSQLVLGSELKTLYWEHVTFQAEIGFELNDAFTYVSIGANFDLGKLGSGGSSVRSTPTPSGGGFQN